MFVSLGGCFVIPMLLLAGAFALICVVSKRRATETLCPNCLHSTRGLHEARCPECGCSLQDGVIGQGMTLPRRRGHLAVMLTLVGLYFGALGVAAGIGFASWKAQERRDTGTVSRVRVGAEFWPPEGDKGRESIWIDADGVVDRREPGPIDVVVEWRRPDCTAIARWRGVANPNWVASASTDDPPSEVQGITLDSRVAVEGLAALAPEDHDSPIAQLLASASDRETLALAIELAAGHEAEPIPQDVLRSAAGDHLLRELNFSGGLSGWALSPSVPIYIAWSLPGAAVAILFFVFAFRVGNPKQSLVAFVPDFSRV